MWCSRALFRMVVSWNAAQYLLPRISREMEALLDQLGATVQSHLR